MKKIIYLNPKSCSFLYVLFNKQKPKEDTIIIKKPNKTKK